MAGKRIAREKKTISSMIALYQRRCPEARDDTEHYQALTPMPTSGWIGAYLAKKSRPASSARCTAISPRNAKR